MLSNADFLAKIRFDRAENEPAKICKTFEKCRLPPELKTLTPYERTRDARNLPDKSLDSHMLGVKCAVPSLHSQSWKYSDGL